MKLFSSSSSPLLVLLFNFLWLGFFFNGVLGNAEKLVLSMDDFTTIEHRSPPSDVLDEALDNALASSSKSVYDTRSDAKAMEVILEHPYARIQVQLAFLPNQQIIEIEAPLQTTRKPPYLKHFEVRVCWPATFPVDFSLAICKNCSNPTVNIRATWNGEISYWANDRIRERNQSVFIVLEPVFFGVIPLTTCPSILLGIISLFITFFYTYPYVKKELEI